MANAVDLRVALRAGRCFAVALLLLLAAIGEARSECKGTDPHAWTAATAGEAAMCLTNLETFNVKECGRELCKRIGDWYGEPPESRARAASDILVLIRDDLKNKVIPGFEEGRPVLDEMDRWLIDMKAIRVSDIHDGANSPFAKKGAAIWRYDTVAKTLLRGQPGELDLNAILKKECGITAERCTRALRGSGELVVHAQMMQTIGNGLLQQERDIAVKYVETIDKQWSNYFDASRFQYPWELWINSARFDSKGKRGLVPPPEDQIIFLHPSVGMRYTKKGDRRFEQALVLEVIGYYKWNWSGTDPKNLIGGSLIAVWTDEPNARKAGYGVMFHLPKNVSAGVARTPVAGGHATSLVVSVDVAKLFQDKDGQKAKLLGLK